MITSFPEIMTIGETARYLRISQSSLYKLAQDGRIPCQKVGKHWRFHRETIVHWVAGQNNMAVTPTIKDVAETIDAVKA